MRPRFTKLFTDVEFVSFMKRIAALRHLAAHRGSIVPSDVYVKPEVEPTEEELDKKLSELGRDEFLKDIPAGPYRDKMQATLRQTLRLEIYEKVADGMVMIELNGKPGQIRPMSDIEWNFDKFHAFMVRVLRACTERIEAGQ